MTFKQELNECAKFPALKQWKKEEALMDKNRFLLCVGKFGKKVYFSLPESVIQNVEEFYLLCIWYFINK